MPETAASMLVAIPTDEAVRILNHTSARAAAEVIMKLPVEVSAPLMKAMRLQQAVEILGYVKPATVATLLATADSTSRRLLQLLNPSFRTQVNRFL